MTDRAWFIRPAEVTDVGGIVKLWLDEWYVPSVPRGEYVTRVKPGMIRALMMPSTRVVLACDRGAPDTFWGLGVFHGEDGVYTAFVKRAFRRTGYGENIMRDLLGDRVDRRQWYAHDINGIQRCGVQPKGWALDPFLLGGGS